MQVTSNDSEPSSGGGKDPVPRNLSLVVFVAIGCLTSFLAYLVYKSFAESAPTVLWTHSSTSRDHKYAKGYEPDRLQTVVNRPLASLFEVTSTVEKGQRLYRNAGCALCHGREGKGGVRNPNYINNTFPPLDQMAAKLSLEFPEDVAVAVKVLSSGISLSDLSKPDEITPPPELDIPDAAKVSAKYGIIAKIVFEGTQAGKKDESGPEPIVMPSYRGVLTESELNQLVASFLILYPIEEEEWEDGAEGQE